MNPAPLSCEDFGRDAVEVALGHLGEPRRSELTAHAATCTTCERHLAELVAITDRMLELAPEIEPPAGFEARALAGMAPPGRASAGARRRPVVAFAGAAVLLIALMALALVLSGTGGDEAPEWRAAPIVSRRGDEIGAVELFGADPHRLVVTMEGPADWTGVWTCQVRVGGRWVDVASYTADDVTNGVWAAGLRPPAAEATGMRILGSSGAVIATAELDGP
ncbi:MAG: hypothetical protein WD830_04080 [Chloroflexota bacterium]